jgi:hypothetical protein
MSLKLAQYSPKLVTVVFFNYLMSGFGKDIFINAEREEDGFTLSTGVDGNSALAMNLNEAGSVKLTFFHTSPANDFLAGIYQTHRATGLIQPGGGMIKDLNGRMLVFAQNAWVKKLPAIQRGKDIQEIEWEIATDNLDMHPLGNVAL